MFARMPDRLLRRATTVHADATHRQHDVRISGGHVVAVGDLDPEPGEEVVDLDGYLLLPAAVEPHAHLDKAFLAEHIDNPTGDLIGAIEAMRENRHLMAVSKRTQPRAWRRSRVHA